MRKKNIMNLGLPSDKSTNAYAPGTLVIQASWFTRMDIQSNPDVLYAWGDNLARFGGANNPKSGQAFACRGERNAVGIPTKRLPSMNDEAFFTDADDAPGSQVRTELDEAFDRLEAHLRDGGAVVWPADGVGTGRAQLTRRAPAVWKRLQDRYDALQNTARVIVHTNRDDSVQAGDLNGGTKQSTDHSKRGFQPR